MRPMSQALSPNYAGIPSELVGEFSNVVSRFTPFDSMFLQQIVLKISIALLTFQGSDLLSIWSVFFSFWQASK